MTKRKRSSKRRPTVREEVLAQQEAQTHEVLDARRAADAGTGVFQENIRPYLATMLLGARIKCGEHAADAAKRVLDLPKDVGRTRARETWADYERRGFGPDDPNWRALTRYAGLDPTAVRMMEKGYPWVDVVEGNEPANLWGPDPERAFYEHANGVTPGEVLFGREPAETKRVETTPDLFGCPGCDAGVLGGPCAVCGDLGLVTKARRDAFHEARRRTSVEPLVVDEAFRRLFDAVLQRLFDASFATMAPGEQQGAIVDYVKTVTNATFDVIDLCRKGGRE